MYIHRCCMPFFPCVRLQPLDVTIICTYYVCISTHCNCYSDDKRDYALKQIEGTGISMSACREIAVSVVQLLYVSVMLVSIIYDFSFCVS